VIDSAIVIISSAHNSEELGARFEAVSIPTVFLNPGRPISFNAVACDDLGGIAMAFDYLRGLGHEAARIAF
jgi:DNA-binding LacI/PurR family transcriptional regulator